MHANENIILGARATSAPLTFHSPTPPSGRPLLSAATADRQRVRRRWQDTAAELRVSAEELRALRDALARPRSTQDRVMDRVVDRLARDLGL